ncbi:unknown [Bacteroides sp. CAG:661]|nr:unknown [Bacteroides sp. CAG:661]
MADAVLAKWSDARTGNVKLNFLNAKMEIVGDETPYDLVAMTFQKGSKLTTGSVNVAEQVFFGNDSFDVMSGATANFTKGAKNNLVAYNIDSQ